MEDLELTPLFHDLEDQSRDISVLGDAMLVAKIEGSL